MLYMLVSMDSQFFCAELMINIAIVSMHAILYIDILGPTFVMSSPVPLPMYGDQSKHIFFSMDILLYLNFNDGAIELLMTCQII